MARGEPRNSQIGTPLGNVTIHFADEENLTNATGIVTFFAPQVDKNTAYSITAEKTTYESGTTTITVLNQGQPQQTTGWIYGIITNADTHVALQSVEIDVALSDSIYKTTFTDTAGRYVLLLPVGTYIVHAQKQGYISETSTATSVIKNTALDQNFMLEKNQTPSPGQSNDEQRIVEYTIQQQATLGTIGGRITLNQHEKTISYYTDNIRLELNTTPTLVTVTIGGENRTTGTILIFSIGTGTLTDLNNITVTYDGQTITETTDVAEFFTINQNTSSHWLRFLTTTGLYLFVQVPHFSNHIITISTPGRNKEINEFMFISLYIAIVLIVTLVAVVHMKKIWKQ